MPIKRWWLALSLRYQVVFLIFLVLIVVGVPAAALMLRVQQQAAEANLKQSALVVAEVVLHTLETDMKSNNRQHIDATLADITDGGYVSEALIISNSGLVFASSEPSDIGKRRSTPEITSALSSGKSQVMAKKGHNDVLVPVLNAPDCYACHDARTPVLGVIEIGLSNKAIALQTRSSASLMIVIAAVTILLVGIVLVYVLRRAVLKPLTNHVARIVDEHEREERLYFTGRLSTIGEMVAGVAHELNNPLTGIIGFSDLLLKADVPDDVKEDLRVINNEAQRVAQIVRNLLTFARKHPDVKQPLNINETIRQVLALRAYEQKVNNIQVITNLAADLPEITANPFQLQQVFINIIINAEHFMIEAHRGGTLTITTERMGGMIRVSLADDGPGIPKENLAHIFDPFFTTKDVGKGTGLGLSICHGIVTEHSGRIYAESELGKGATFIVELPVGTESKE
ncbi:MAG: hypothetical protein HY663_04480 [Chloroflexi bacterium]|nr:hypothetical protein [Chloroflexota bacterium]